MFKRPHHQIVASVLADMDARFLRATNCYFGGGTAISMLMGEFRESVDMDFLCSDQEGYRVLRESVFDRGMSAIIPSGVEVLRELRADRDGIRAVLLKNGVPIKFEIVREARITLSPDEQDTIPVPCLSRTDLFAEKLLANADRFADRSVMSRDAIDLLMMTSVWREIPEAAWKKAAGAYGKSVFDAWEKAKALLQQNGYLEECAHKMGISREDTDRIAFALNAELAPITRRDTARP